VFTRPRHRYTQGLVASSDLSELGEDGRLPTIPGSVPAAGHFPDGCVFRNRCTHATEQCAQRPSWTPTVGEGGYACFHPAEQPSLAGEGRA
jgi:peptide/nickel transport system ATP-binding protein